LTELVNDKDFVLPGQPLTDEKEKGWQVHLRPKEGSSDPQWPGMVRMRVRSGVIPARGPYKPRETTGS
jgi:hypothetical protein